VGGASAKQWAVATAEFQRDIPPLSPIFSLLSSLTSDIRHALVREAVSSQFGE